jgi:hypothetical protein
MSKIDTSPYLVRGLAENGLLGKWITEHYPTKPEAIERASELAELNKGSFRVYELTTIVEISKVKISERDPETGILS